MKKTRRMPRASQVAFAKSWLEAQNIEAQTIDVHSLIDGSLSYEENIKNLKQHLNLAGRSRKMATRTMTASECDVSIGNFGAGFNGIEAKRACACGDPDACDHVAKKARAKAKPKPKKKAVTATKPKPVKSKPKTVTKKKRSAQKTISGKTKPQKKPKKKRVCTVVKVKGYTRKCPTRRR